MSSLLSRESGVQSPWPSSSPVHRSVWFALQRAPFEASSWMGLGELAQQEGALPLARAAYRAAAELDEDSGEAAARLGYVLFEEGRDQEAVASLANAKALGADAALVDLTWAMMRVHVELAGPFPRFSPWGAGNPSALPAEHQAPATVPPFAAEASAPSTAEPWVSPLGGPSHEGAEERGGATPPEARAENEAADDAEDTGGDERARAEPSAGDTNDDETAKGRGQLDTGPCEVSLTRQGDSGIFVVEALVQGHEARLIVDTGASLTVLAQEFLEASGLQLEEEGTLTARTAGGARTFKTATVGELGIGGRSVEELRVAICDECGMPGSDGLLGLDVQEPLGLSLFPSLGILRVEDCVTGGEPAE